MESYLVASLSLRLDIRPVWTLDVFADADGDLTVALSRLTDTKHSGKCYLQVVFREHEANCEGRYESIKSS